MIGIIILLFSISLCLEVANLDFTLELRGLVFAIGVSCLFGSLIFGREPSEKNKLKLNSLDIAYIAVSILTVISFLTKAESVYAFHNTFVQIGMTILCFFVRTTKLNEEHK